MLKWEQICATTFHISHLKCLQKHILLSCLRDMTKRLQTSHNVGLIWSPGTAVPEWCSPMCSQEVFVSLANSLACKAGKCHVTWHQTTPCGHVPSVFVSSSFLFPCLVWFLSVPWTTFLLVLYLRSLPVSLCYPDLHFVQFLLSDYFCFVASLFFVTCILYVQPLFIEGEEAKEAGWLKKQKSELCLPNLKSRSENLLSK